MVTSSQSRIGSPATRPGFQSYHSNGSSMIPSKYVQYTLRLRSMATRTNCTSRIPSQKKCVTFGGLMMRIVAVVNSISTPYPYDYLICGSS